MVRILTPLGALCMAALCAGVLLAPARPAAAAVEEGKAPVADAKTLIDRGDYRGAEIQLRNALKSQPDSPDLHVQLAQVYLRLGNYPAAEAEARTARDKGGDEDSVAPVLAEALLDQNKLSQLVDQVKPADREPTAESIVRLELGLAHLGLREYTDAEPLLRDAERLDPGNWRPKLAVARLAMIHGDVAAAQHEIDAARTVAPDNIEVIRFQGEILRVSGDTAGAIAAFDKVLASRPNDLSALLSRANVLIADNRLDDARHDIDAALKLSPKNIPANYLSALLLAKQGKLQAADDLLAKMSSSFTALPQGYYLDGAIKFALGQYEQADEFLQKFIARKPDQPNARRLLAAIALRKNDYARAIDLLKPVVAASPTDTRAIQLLARAYVAAGKKDAAVELYEQAATVNPNDAQAQTRSALMRIRYGDATEGVTDLEKIAETDKGADVAGPLLVLGQLEQGDVAKAAATAEGMAQREPDDPVVQNLLGSTRLAQGRLADAEKIFQGLVAKDPKFLASRRNLALVLRAENRPADARKVYLDLLALAPGDERSLLSLADLAIVDGDADEALTRLRQASAAAPNDPTPGQHLVQFYVRQHDWNKAQSAAQDLESHFPGNPGVVDLAATTRLQAGDAAGAAAEYRALVAKMPTSDRMWRRYAAFQDRANDKDGERTSLMKAHTLNPASEPYMEDLVKLDYATKGAAAALATARGFAPDQPIVSALLVSQVLISDKRLPEAIDELTKAQQRQPAAPLAVRLAQITYASGKQDDAKAMLVAWVKDHDADVIGRIGLGDLLMAQHDYDGAQSVYEAAHDRAPNNVVALNNLAWIYARKHDARASDFARQAYRLAPTPQTADTLGWILVGGGDPKGALGYLRRASAAMPNDAAIQYHLAVALKATGDTDQAKTVLEQALKEKAPFDGKDDAQKLLEELSRG